MEWKNCTFDRGKTFRNLGGYLYLVLFEIINGGGGRSMSILLGQVKRILKPMLFLLWMELEPRDIQILEATNGLKQVSNNSCYQLMDRCIHLFEWFLVPLKDQIKIYIRKCMLVYEICSYVVFYCTFSYYSQE